MMVAVPPYEERAEQLLREARELLLARGGLSDPEIDAWCSRHEIHYCSIDHPDVVKENKRWENQ